MACGKLCPIEETVNLISHKWKILILRNLQEDGTQRFTELANGINGISEKVLSQQLRQMEADNLIIRKVYPEVPPKVEYSLSELGKSLKPVLDSMNVWGGNYIKTNKHLYED